MEQEQRFIDYIEQSIVQNWDRNALTDYKGITLQYKDVARKIAKFHIVLESAGIQPGDKIAVCGRNSAHWAVCFLATQYRQPLRSQAPFCRRPGLGELERRSHAAAYGSRPADGFHSGRLPG